MQPLHLVLTSMGPGLYGYGGVCGSATAVFTVFFYQLQRLWWRTAIINEGNLIRCAFSVTPKQHQDIKWENFCRLLLLRSVKIATNAVFVLTCSCTLLSDRSLHMINRWCNSWVTLTGNARKRVQLIPAGGAPYCGCEKYRHYWELMH